MATSASITIYTNIEYSSYDTGATTALVVKYASGSLPEGITVSYSGTSTKAVLISGRPLATGTFTYTITSAPGPTSTAYQTTTLTLVVVYASQSGSLNKNYRFLVNGTTDLYSSSTEPTVREVSGVTSVTVANKPAQITVTFGTGRIWLTCSGFTSAGTFDFTVYYVISSGAGYGSVDCEVEVINPTATLYIDANGGTVNTPASGSWTQTDTALSQDYLRFDLSSTYKPSVSRTNYVLKYYTDNAAGTGTKYNSVTSNAYGSGYQLYYDVAAGGSATLYAQWIHVYTATLTEYGNGGTNQNSASSATVGFSNVGSLAGTPCTRTIPYFSWTRSGYTLSSMNTKADGTGTSYPVGTSYTFADGETLTLYCIWTVNPTQYTYTVNYDANGGANAPAAQTVTSYNTSQQVTLSTSQPTKSGSDFLGWATAADATAAAYQPGDTVTLASASPSLTLYAVWSAAALEFTSSYTAYLSVGETVSYTPTYSVSGVTLTMVSGPSWLGISGGTLTGTVQLPGGYVRVLLRAYVSETQQAVQVCDLYVRTPAVTQIWGRWEARIYDPTGGCVRLCDATMDPVHALEQPDVKLNTSAPCSCSVEIAIPDLSAAHNILAANFTGWSDTYVGPVQEGMQLVVYVLDEGTGQIVMIHNGRIHKVVAGDTVTVTSYDRLMRLYDYREPVELYGTYVVDRTTTYTDTSTARVFTAGSTVSSLLSLQLVDAKAVAPAAGSAVVSPCTQIIHRLPTVNGSGAMDETSAYTIKTVTADLATRLQRSAAAGYDRTLHYRALIYGGTAAAPDTSEPLAVSAWYTDVSSGYDLQQISFELDFEADPDAVYYLGIEGQVQQTGSAADGYGLVAAAYDSGAVADGYYGLTDGTWSTVSATVRWGLTWEGPRSVDTSAVTVADTAVTVPLTDVTGTVIPNVTAYGIAAIIRYYTGTIPVDSMATTLIDRAGLKPDDTVSGQSWVNFLDFYSTSTYNYLECIRELLEIGSKTGTVLCIRDSLDYPGVVSIVPRHALTDTAVQTLTTSPAAAGVHKISALSLSRNWEAENATVAYLSHTSANDTQTEYPLAIMTDDRLWPDSLAERLDDPLIGYFTDDTLLRHSSLAVAAESKVRTLHQNAVEGTLTLRGLWASLWALAGAYGGGNVVSLTIPTYGLTGVAAKATVMELKAGQTILTLDNVRDIDRSTIYQTITRSADGQTYAVASLPAAAYIFARYDGVLPSVLATSVKLIADDDTVIATQETAAYLKITVDHAGPNDGDGYVHHNALYVDAEAVNSGYATESPIRYVELTIAGAVYYVTLLQPIYAWPGQYVHVSVRGRRQ